jgi:hypothetical protein
LSAMKMRHGVGVPSIRWRLTKLIQRSIGTSKKSDAMG